MEQRRRPEYNLEIFADLACVKDVVKGGSIFAVLPASSYASVASAVGLEHLPPLPLRPDIEP
jgi:hypothetical protein